ncbi:MAG: response regulator [Anaerolineae bacterium]
MDYPIKVAIVDDQEVVRAGLAVFLRAFDDMELVASVTDGADALVMCLQSRPDVVLMDIIMPGMNGVYATRLVCKACPQIRVIAMTSYDDQGLIQQILDNGAVMCLRKSASIDEMAAAIRSVFTVSKSSDCMEA